MTNDLSAGLAGQLQSLDSAVFDAKEQPAAKRMLFARTEARVAAANRQSSEAWRAIRSLADWERFRDERIVALRRAIGVPPTLFEPVARASGPSSANHGRDAHATSSAVEVTGTVVGDGFRIENIVFASRPGELVTANLYVPDLSPASAMPGIVLAHSHHNPKTQVELQDMGMIWARSGAMVIVPDLPGHGERRQHPFCPDLGAEAAPVLRRQDYHSRYAIGMQMHVAGETLIGWMAADLIRCVDVLLGRGGVDPKRIIMIGAVAGGGDPVAVAAALDQRIACAVPFNFGGPQPESPYPLPEDAEESFNYAGWGYWESSRSIRRSAADGFLPWVIVGAIAPRRLIYAHEFSWDRPHDPVWPRLERIYEFYGAKDRLGFAHGFGVLQGVPPAASHCNNVGVPHRAMIYPLLERWFAMPVPAEYQQRVGREQLQCLTPAVLAASRPKKFRELLAERAEAHLAPDGSGDKTRRPAGGDGAAALRERWQGVLGEMAPAADFRVERCTRTVVDGVTAEKVLLRVEEDILVPVLLLLPKAGPGGGRVPVVVAIAQAGKAGFLGSVERRSELADLLRAGIAVCLPDVRGAGETDPGDGRGPDGQATEISMTELMLGQPLLGSRLGDLRTVLAFLRTRPEIDAGRTGLWGESLAAGNPPGLVEPPATTDNQPAVSEPLGGLLAMLGALFEPEVKAVLVRGGLTAIAALLDAWTCHVPHDIIVPHALEAGDLGDVAAALAPRPLRLEALVDGRNIATGEPEMRKRYATAVAAYAAAGGRLELAAERGGDAAAWLSVLTK